MDSAVVAVITGFVASVVAAILVLFFQRTKEAKYNESLKRVELDLLRKSFETSIYNNNSKLLSDPARWKDVNHLLISQLESSLSEPDGDTKPVIYSSFLQNIGLGERDLFIERDLIFVLTPFHPRFQETYDVVHKIAKDVGMRALRGDEEHVSANLLRHVIKQLVKARVIVANIDGRSPNVFYELGIAHALGKEVILISNSIEEVPFDIRSNKLVIYKDVQQLSSLLKKELTRSLVKT
uniref:Nucleoside 2-deoxyribosyltransferase n=1 Tax=Candidatus Kentrum sp. MB TaxID=2138164 RepID=A0A451BC53_9GAMM|nr:MAG: hypothetical protein BECKMB1821I_GA0114274_102536 [Candidatus Kentron sp. MB]VFK75862.1 MAG: hypothetical protein BECKMB1821H_GA0114242_10342 [Candidatus Kentron sp. MB]